MAARCAPDLHRDYEILTSEEAVSGGANRETGVTSITVTERPVVG
jgi:hypothetical protein